MATPNNGRDRLIRVHGPALPVVRLTADPVPMPAVRLTLPLAPGADGEERRRALHALVKKLNEMEAIGGRPGVWVDGTLSRVGDGEVVIVLAPYDLTDAVETCKRIANILFHASPGVTVKVFAAGEPDTPVYELAA